MAYAISPIPNTGIARESQRASEESLANVGGAIADQAKAGRSIANQGQSDAIRWGQRGTGMYDRLQGLASREPTWYADRAAVTSGQAFDESQGIQNRLLSRMGINPNSGRFVGLQTQWGLARAAAEAGARTKAMQDAEEVAYGRQRDLLGYTSGQQEAGRRQQALGAGMGADTAGKYSALSGQYGQLASEQEQAGAMTKAGQMNEIQSRFDKMLLDVQNMPRVNTNIRTSNANKLYSSM